MKNGVITTLTPDDKQFPQRLKNTPDPPKQLYLRGNIPRDDQLTIAIIGSRKHSAYGKAVTQAIVESLAVYQPWIVSGLALGLDAVAHRAALDNDLPTLAVLPAGVDKVHLATNRGLGQDIIDHGGGWLSEQPSGSPIRKHSFLIRNRLVSGISDAVIVIEAGQRSGTLSTARWALEQGRELIAVPGPITSATSRGTNQLIQAGAHCLSQPEDIAAILDLEAKHRQQKRYRYDNDTQRAIHTSLLDGGKQSGDAIINQLQIERSEYLSAITMLELNGYIFPHGGDLWSAK
jgi:DNA processing protein